MLMPDTWIKRQALDANMISPFISKKCSETVLSYGLSSYGYDARVANKFKIFSNANAGIIDPKNIDEKVFIEKSIDNNDGYCIIPPNSYILGHTVEYFRIPRGVFVLCIGKSTYARSGTIVNVTPLEPGWEGNVTLEFSNSTTLPSKIYVNEGACQFIFFRSEEECSLSYKELHGKYMFQTGITLPKVE